MSRPREAADRTRSKTPPATSEGLVGVNECALLDRFKIIVDPNAEPTGVDLAVAEFLLSFVSAATASESTVEQGREPHAQKESVAAGADHIILNRSEGNG